MAHLDEKLARVRELTARSRRSGATSFYAFKDLVSFLLHQTIAKPSAVISLTDIQRHPREMMIGAVPEPTDGIPLSNGHYLRTTISLYLDKDHLKVIKSSYQYQLDQEGSEWIFRYDFLRNPPPGNLYSPSHLQINANLREAKRILRDCPKIHFPVGRTSLEAVVRLLATQFGVKCREKHWEKVLTESEQLFQ